MAVIKMIVGVRPIFQWWRKHAKGAWGALVHSLYSDNYINESSGINCVIVRYLQSIYM